MGRTQEKHVDLGRNWHVAIVGSGPAGMYATEALVKRGAQVDVFEHQFAPFGLVRYGVAPDHQKIKKTQVVFQRALNHEAVRLFAGVELGRHISLGELQELYDQVLITVGSAGARSLNIPGEGLENSVSATDLVNWYNGHPDFVGSAPKLDHERAVVVGMGNVAIDVARILLRDAKELAKTDIAQPALDVLRRGNTKEVILLARRGPNQAAFSDKEVRELDALDGIEVVVDGYVSKRKTTKSDFIAGYPRYQPRMQSKRRVVLRFCESPVEIVGDSSVKGLKTERNDLVESAARMRAVGTGKITTVPCGLVVRAIGYHGVPVPDVPYHPDTGTVPNEAGRVLVYPDGPRVPALYVAGWAKRGPTGLIGTNKSCANETVALMEEDLDQVGPYRDPEAIITLLSGRTRVFSKHDWARLNEWELKRGAECDTPRIKVLSAEQAATILDQES